MHRGNLPSVTKLLWIVVLISLATASARAEEPDFKIDAPIPDLPFNETTVEAMCSELREGAVQEQYDAARYLLEQAKLGNIAPEAMDCLLHSVEHGTIQPIQAHSGHTLGHYGEAAVPGLLDIAHRQKDNNAYWVATGMLRSLGPKAKVAEDEMFLAMNNQRTPAKERLDAATIVWAIGSSETKDLAYQVMLNLVETADAETRGHAALALVKTKRAKATTHLAHCALRHKDWAWRLLCTSELGNIAAGLRQPLNPAEATRYLMQVKDDPHAEVRQRAESALEYAEQ